MKSGNRKLLILESIILLVVLFTFFQPFLFDHYRYLIFLLIIGFVSYYFIGIDINRMPDSKKMIVSELIVILSYFLITYLSGLFVGFSRTIYSWSFTNLVKNIIPTLTVILVCELLRYQFIKKSNRDKFVVILSFLSFLLLDVSLGFYNYDLSIQEDVYEFIGLIIIGGFAKNFLMTVLDIYGDCYNSILYRLIMEIYVFIVPIVPNFGIYIDSVLLIVLPVIVAFVVINGKNLRMQKPMEKQKSNAAFYTVFIILILLVLLNSGFFKYQSLVIGSNSMKPKITKGDVIIMEKLSKEEYKKLKKGDIIVFKYQNRLIAHRIYSIISGDEKVYYITKGDYNAQPDAVATESSNVSGIVRLKIEKIGLPSIWLNELFQ